MVVIRRFVEIIGTASLLAGVLIASPGGEDIPPAAAETLRDSFETVGPTWQREYTDAPVSLPATIGRHGLRTVASSRNTSSSSPPAVASSLSVTPRRKFPSTTI